MKQRCIYPIFLAYPTTINQDKREYWLNYFLQAGFLEQTSAPDEHRRVLRTARLTGGLAHYKWDTKAGFEPLSRVSKYRIVQFLFILFKVNKILKRAGIAGVGKELQKQAAKSKGYRAPTQEEIKGLVSALDAACALYPKKAYCLVWATAFVLGALKNNLRCNLVIGVQTMPFYAHAWAEVNGAVVHDAQIIQDYLAVLLKEPFQSNLYS